MPSFTAKGPLVGGALAAIGASVCCVGPLVLLTPGIGGAWIANLTALEPIRPVFIGLTLVLLGLAFRRLYLQPQVCEPGMPCAQPLVLRRQASALHLLGGRTGTACASIRALAGTAVPLKGSGMRRSLAAMIVALSPLAVLAASPQTTTLNVQNMTCALCPFTVKKSPENVPGVMQARIDFEKKTATVMFDADKTTAAALVKATTEAGYTSAVRK
jgi:mercuric ion transport protein